MIKWPIILLTLLHYLFAADFKILSFNIHALHPIIANDNPKERLIEILKNTTSFEFIFFQENAVTNRWVHCAAQCLAASSDWGLR